MFEFEFRAYCKLSLHITQNQNGVDCGLLLGESDNLIQDCIPLFHNSINLSLPFEIAVAQVKAFTQKGGNVIGFYYCSNSAVSDIPANAKTTFELLMSYFSTLSLFVLVDAKQLAVGSDLGVRLFSKEYSQIETVGVTGSEKVDDVKIKIKKRNVRVYDFDDHLDDISKNWKNVSIK